MWITKTALQTILPIKHLSMCQLDTHQKPLIISGLVCMVKLSTSYQQVINKLSTILREPFLIIEVAINRVQKPSYQHFWGSLLLLVYIYRLKAC
jgi:hypothetical protein